MFAVISRLFPSFSFGQLAGILVALLMFGSQLCSQFLPEFLLEFLCDLLVAGSRAMRLEPARYSCHRVGSLASLGKYFL